MINGLPSKEGCALQNVNWLQSRLDNIKFEIENMANLLESEGWEIEFSIINPLSDFGLDSDLRMWAETDDITLCKATKQVEKDKKLVVEKKAVLADDDIFIEELGEYLALARVYDEVM